MPGEDWQVNEKLEHHEIVHNNVVQQAFLHHFETRMFLIFRVSEAWDLKAIILNFEENIGAITVVTHRLGRKKS